MLSKWPIRNKLVVCLALLLVIVLTLSWSAFYGLYAYRGLVKSLERVEELRLATELIQQVSDLRVSASKISLLSPLEFSFEHDPETSSYSLRVAREEFRQELAAVKQSLAVYRLQLDRQDYPNHRIGDSQNERETVRRIEAALSRIDPLRGNGDWMLDPFELGKLNGELEQLQALSGKLPGYLHRNIHGFTDDVRDKRRTFVAVAWTSSAAALVMMTCFLRLVYKWVFRPLRVLVKGSRKVAAGNFDYRIQLDTRDEMAELAEALNDMTDRFQSIRDGLDRQVQERTRQVVRSEQLASVGFLAAGVAHEINNPLASIAMCAESLEGRAASLVDEDHPDYAVLRSYLRMIQDEAFRCKEITSKLLDFSRLGDASRQPAELRELVQGVIEMVGHLGKYQTKHIEFLPGEPVLAAVNTQEIKQVVLNLITNALESVESGGVVTVQLAERGRQAELVVADNGCGMTEEVLQHLFEPFFTRRRHGQGTGLGLSITYRIIEEHGGQIEPASDGPGRGSRFTVRLPLAARSTAEQENHHRYQAA